MTPEMEQQVLSSLYDRLWDAVSYCPDEGKQAAFARDTTFLQLSTGEPLNPADFANALSPLNPEGDPGAAEAFSQLVDTIPAVQADYAPSARRVSEVYKTIVNDANSIVMADPSELANYDRAFALLNVTTSVADAAGETTTRTSPSPLYRAYLSNHQDYVAALVAYRSAYLSHDMSKTSDEQAWQALAPSLQAAVDSAWNNWRENGAAEVEQALATLVTSSRCISQDVIVEARRTMKSAGMASRAADGSLWYPAYSLPLSWSDLSSDRHFSALSLRSSYLSARAGSTFSGHGGGASWSEGLWSVGGNAEGSSGPSRHHLEATDLSLSAKIAVVRFYRPWFNDAIFRMTRWFVDYFKRHEISSGTLEGNKAPGIGLPLIPIAFVVARDISITADFSPQDQSIIQRAISGSTNVGWGPFRIGGSYSHSTSTDTFQPTFDGRTLEVPGLHIIGWLNELLPAGPPQQSVVIDRTRRMSADTTLGPLRDPLETPEAPFSAFPRLRSERLRGFHLPPPPFGWEDS